MRHYLQTDEKPDSLDHSSGEVRQWNRSFIWSVLPLIAFVLVLNFVTMPAEEYPGDAMAVRLEAISLINLGQWAVPQDIAIQCGAPGQYFYQSSKGAWYPKYGILNTWIYVPCLWLEKIVGGRLAFRSDNTLYLNLFNVVLSGVTATYLALLARRHTRSIVTIWLFVIASLYSTFWWNYLRAQTFETYVTLFMLAFYYHFISAWNGQRSSRCNRHLLIAAICLGLLCLCKAVYVILLPVIIGFFALSKRGYFRSRSLKTGRDSFDGQFLFFWLPLSIFLCVLLASNWYKFGSPFNIGYMQWNNEAQPFTVNLFPALSGFIASKQRSIFLHFPVLLFALIGWPSFFRKQKSEALLIASLGAVLLLVNSTFANWEGEACYGPRYLLPILPILSLPFVHLLNWMSSVTSNIVKWAMRGAVAASLGYSFLLQVSANSLPFFFWYELLAIPEGETSSAPVDYLNSHHFGTINADFVRYARGAPSPLIRDFVNHLEPAAFGRLEALKAETRFNYFWFPNFVETVP